MSTRGQRLYDWWSRNRWALSLLYGFVFLGREGQFRHRSVAALELEPGDRVLELGCGPGNNFARLREAVGESGTVVGLDYSAGMVDRARARVAAEGWENVHVARGDASAPGVREESFDAVYLAMSLSAMPDARAVLAAASRALRPGGRVAILDAQPFQPLVLRPLNLLFVPLFSWATNWYPDTDVPAALRETFPTVSVSTWSGGTVLIGTGRTDPQPTE